MKTVMSRREAFQSGASLLAAVGLIPVSFRLQAEEPYADPLATEKWLNLLLDAPGAVSGALHMGRFKDRIYYLLKEISWAPDAGQDGSKIVVPAGFVTDLASIPRVFWSLLPTDGAYTYPAIIHDYLYWTQEYPRDIADKIFQSAMQDLKISKSVTATIYNAVRVGGGAAWDNNAKLKKAGEMRFLIKFPSDPRTSWKEWKQSPDCCK